MAGKIVHLISDHCFLCVLFHGRLKSCFRCFCFKKKNSWPSPSVTDLRIWCFRNTNLLLLFITLFPPHLWNVKHCPWRYYSLLILVYLKLAQVCTSHRQWLRCVKGRTVLAQQVVVSSGPETLGSSCTRIGEKWTSAMNMRRNSEQWSLCEARFTLMQRLLWTAQLPMAPDDQISKCWSGPRRWESGKGVGRSVSSESGWRPTLGSSSIRRWQLWVQPSHNIG